MPAIVNLWLFLHTREGAMARINSGALELWRPVWIWLYHFRPKILFNCTRVLLLKQVSNSCVQKLALHCNIRITGTYCNIDATAYVITTVKVRNLRLHRNVHVRLVKAVPVPFCFQRPWIFVDYFVIHSTLLSTKNLWSQSFSIYGIQAMKRRKSFHLQDNNLSCHFEFLLPLILVCLLHFIMYAALPSAPASGLPGWAIAIIILIVIIIIIIFFVVIAMVVMAVVLWRKVLGGESLFFVIIHLYCTSCTITYSSCRKGKLSIAKRDAVSESDMYLWCYAMF